MAQNYAAFKAYVIKYVWRDNDTDLAASMDILIQQANDELDVMTRDFQRRQGTASIAPTTQDFDVVAAVPDYQSTQALIGNAGAKGDYTYTTLGEVHSLRSRATGTIMPFYSTDRSDGTLYIRLVAPELSVEEPADLTLVYKVGVPNYAVTDSSWVEDEYLNLYLYTVLKHCAMFLREDERIQTYASLQQEAFTNADIDDKHNLQFGGSSLQMRPHHYVP